VLPNLSELVKTAEELELTVLPAGKKLGKADYARELKKHFLPNGGLPYEELIPMLCFAEWNLKEAEREKIWKSPTWVAQRKLNGCRIILHFVKGVGVFAHSRTVSLKTYRFQELTGQLLFHDFIPNFNATVDAEVIVEKPIDSRNYTAKGEITKTSLHSTTVVLHLEAENSRKIQREQDAALSFQCFDVTQFNGHDLKGLRLAARLTWLNSFQNAIESTSLAKYFGFPELARVNKKEFFQKIVDEGGEGVILKNLESTYIDSSSRRRDAWVKVKRRQEYDAFVMGFKRGEEGSGWENLVGAIAFGVKTENGETHQIAFASNLKMTTRERITIYDPETNEVKLNQNLYGRVAEVSGQDISARSLRLSHAIIERWRPKDGPDAKRAEDCKVSLEDLRTAAEWVS